MRILFTFAGGYGHFEPLSPIARAAVSAGHTVAVAGRASLAETVQAAGLTAFESWPPLPAWRTSGGSAVRLPLLPVDLDRASRELRDGFADRGAHHRAPEILALAATWQPDLIVCDETDFGAMVAAERLGLPYASVQVLAAGSFVQLAQVAEPLNRLRAAHGLPPDPELTMLSRYLVLSPFPPSFRDPAFPAPPTTHAIRTAASAPASEPPPWWTGQDRPTLYFTLGTVFNVECGDLFGRVLAGLRDLAVQVIATSGNEIDPAEFGPQPPHIHIAPFIPQATVLPICDLCLTHGGSGSVVGALAHGLPMVLLPLGADQPLNGQRCAALGVGRVLDVMTATPDDIGAAVLAALNDAPARAAAERLRDEIYTLPGPAHALALLERLAAEKQPIPSG
jgi:UDP:flavonoid glycosyltransferase YjiC (YdhE family)